MIDLNDFRLKLSQTINHLQNNLATVRTGRATSALIENIVVSTYGGQAKLKVIELATIINEGAQTLLVTPFDQAVKNDLEKALRESNLGFSVSVSESQIRVKMPPLTEEQRQKYLKLVSQFCEEGREGIRRQRDEIRKKVREEFVHKELSEEQKYRLEEEIDKTAKEFTDKIEELKKHKEEEILNI